ncbi:MAG: flagellar basal body L-ring protein FlgH [Vampirovibrionales bacterium]|nr:flagellar basal body L-ring protein FlgH [Vampirovibrionales bacterium]
MRVPQVLSALSQSSASTRFGSVALFGVLLSVTASGMWLVPAQAESLFHASATTYAHTGEPQYRPPSLIGSPVPRNVGDMVTITLNQQSRNEVEVNNRINKRQTVDENGSTLFNNAVVNVLDKLPFLNAAKLGDVLSVPSFDGLDTANETTAKASTQKRTLMDDKLTCQVVQILPNGFLMIQGKKSILMNKEQQDVFVTGIVNPFYLNSNNEINSQYVASLQYNVGGRGVATRQQNDGIVNKLYQFFN